MLAQIFAVVIFIAMFVFIVTEIIERHVVSLVSALLTMILVFGVGMHSLEAVWETLNISSIVSPGFWYAGAASHGSAAGFFWKKCYNAFKEGRLQDHRILHRFVRCYWGIGANGYIRNRSWIYRPD